MYIQLFSDLAPTPNQFAVMRKDVKVTAKDLLLMPSVCTCNWMSNCRLPPPPSAPFQRQ